METGIVAGLALQGLSRQSVHGDIFTTDERLLANGEILLSEDMLKGMVLYHTLDGQQQLVLFLG